VFPAFLHFCISAFLHFCISAFRFCIPGFSAPALAVSPLKLDGSARPRVRLAG